MRRGTKFSDKRASKTDVGPMIISFTRFTNRFIMRERRKLGQHVGNF